MMASIMELARAAVFKSITFVGEGGAVEQSWSSLSSTESCARQSRHTTVGATGTHTAGSLDARPESIVKGMASFGSAQNL